MEFGRRVDRWPCREEEEEENEEDDEDEEEEEEEEEEEGKADERTERIQSGAIRINHPTFERRRTTWCVAKYSNLGTPHRNPFNHAEPAAREASPYIQLFKPMQYKVQKKTRSITLHHRVVSERRV